MNGWGEGREPEDGGSVQKNEWGQEFEACHFILARGTKKQSAGFKHLNYQESQNGAPSGESRTPRSCLHAHGSSTHTLKGSTLGSND